MTKSNFMLRDALSRYTSFVGSAATFPSKGKAHCRVLFCRQRFHDCVAANNLFFFLRRKKKREKERPLRGLRREVRFIMSPPGKRRHNELNAAPPPETPRGTGKPGELNNRDVVHSGKSFGIRGKTCLFGEPRGTIPLWLPLRGEGYSVRGRTFNNLNFDLSALCGLY